MVFLLLEPLFSTGLAELGVVIMCSNNYVLICFDFFKCTMNLYLIFRVVYPNILYFASFMVTCEWINYFFKFVWQLWRTNVCVFGRLLYIVLWGF